MNGVGVVFSTGEHVADILSTWQPTPDLRDRAGAGTLPGVPVYSDFTWEDGGAGFGHTSFPGFRALHRELAPRLTRGDRLAILLTQRDGVERELHRLDDGTVCMVYGVSFLRTARYRRSTALVSGVVSDDEHALTTLATVADNPGALIDWLRSPRWREQVGELSTDEAAEYAPRVLRLAKEAMARLPAGTAMTAEDFELLATLFAALVAQAAEHGAAGQVVALLDVDEGTRAEWLRQNQALIERLVRHEFRERDVLSLAHRREQLDVFGKMLNDRAVFDAEKARLEAAGDESVWQHFFEANPWIFGTSLRLVCMSQFHEPSLEAVTTGFTYEEAGKRVDALMKTIGAVQALCFIEIKTHETPLVQTTEYRRECWAPSHELTGGVAQVQKTVQKAMVKVRAEPKDGEGFPLDRAYMFQPKAYVVIGSLAEFVRGGQESEPKFGSFELYRRNLFNPEIVTFDELHAKAAALLDHEATRG